MPYVNVKLIDSQVTKEQKAELVAGITQVLQTVLNKDPEKTFVVIDEVNADNWGLGGELVSERIKQAK